MLNNGKGQNYYKLLEKPYLYYIVPYENTFREYGMKPKFTEYKFSPLNVS